MRILGEFRHDGDRQRFGCIGQRVESNETQIGYLSRHGTAGPAPIGLGARLQKRQEVGSLGMRSENLNRVKARIESNFPATRDERHGAATTSQSTAVGFTGRVL